MSKINHVITTTRNVDQSLTNDPFRKFSWKITHEYDITKKNDVVFRLVCTKSAETKSFFAQSLLEADAFTKTEI